MSKLLVIMVGAPGSGKSTVSEAVATEYGFDIVCPDSIRGELFGDESCQEKGWLVFKIAYERTADALADCNCPGVIFDSTGASRKTRRELARIARENGAKSIVCWVDTDADTCKQRNSSRARVVPNEVIDDISERISNVPPDIDEGHFGVCFPEDIWEELDMLCN